VPFFQVRFVLEFVKLESRLRYLFSNSEAFTFRTGVDFSSLRRNCNVTTADGDGETRYTLAFVKNARVRVLFADRA